MKNQKKIWIAVAGIIIVAGLFFWATPQKEPMDAVIASQINNEGPITVTVTPLITAKNIELSFKIVLDTHIEEISNDMTQSAVMIGDDGKEYIPAAWEGDPPGGHHREGILKFNAVSAAKNFELRIRGIGGVAERIFKWNL